MLSEDVRHEPLDPRFLFLRVSWATPGTESAVAGVDAGESKVVPQGRRNEYCELAATAFDPLSSLALSSHDFRAIGEHLLAIHTKGAQESPEFAWDRIRIGIWSEVGTYADVAFGPSLSAPPVWLFSGLGVASSRERMVAPTVLDPFDLCLPSVHLEAPAVVDHVGSLPSGLHS